MFQKISFRPFLPCATIALALSGVGAQAAYQPVDTFDALSLGNVNGQNGWIDNDDSGQVVLDPAGGDNKVLAVSTDSGVLKKAVVVPGGITGMLFLRLRFEEHGRYSFGMSPYTNPVEYSDFSVELGMAAATMSDPNDRLRAANGGGGTYDDLETLAPDTWYNAWIQMNNPSDTYSVWLNAVPNADADAALDLLDNDLGETVFEYRTGGLADLNSFFIKTGGGGSTVQGTFYLDDIYLDLAPLNLSNPSAIPIPPALWLFGSALLGLVGMARRRKA